jgi:hypothetical protein
MSHHILKKSSTLDKYLVDQVFDWNFSDHMEITSIESDLNQQTLTFDRLISSYQNQKLFEIEHVLMVISVVPFEDFRLILMYQSN